MSEEYAPFVLSSDDHVPLDLSFIFEEERPAGKHGFLKADGDRFVFEDGTEGRFWGVNFNSGANFPSHEYSRMVARRLAKFGVNLVRPHQMDAEWATPNIFQSNRARPKSDTRSLDPESLDRLDYLISCLKEQGIYLYLDMLTYRRFREADGVTEFTRLADAAKPYSYFDDKLIELQKEFARQLWTHVNPYTGLAYKDEPAIVLTEIKNESDLFSQPPIAEPYRTNLEKKYRDWLRKHGLPEPVGTVDFTRRDEAMARFFVEVMRGFYDDMASFLREIGVKIPITGTNWSINLGVTAAQQDMDFTDSHTYWDYPWTAPAGTINSSPMVASERNVFATLSLMRLVDKPFFISEWDQAYPHPWRAESPLAYAAVAAFQGWGGAAIHTYRYGTWHPEDRIGGGASTINGIVYRNFFDTFNDPAKFGLFYQAALLFRRGDVSLGASPVAVDVSNAGLLTSPENIPALRLVERQRIALSFNSDEKNAQGPESVSGIGNEEVVSDNGQLWRSWSKRYGTIITPRTKAAYGFLGNAGAIDLDGVVLDVKTDFATVALSSLSDDPITESASVLLTAVGRCENSDTAYNEERNRLLNSGRAPTKIEVIAATVSIKTIRQGLKVWVISDKGEAVTKLKTTYEAGILRFEIGPQPDWYPSSMYYLITL